MEKLAEIREKHRPGVERALASAEEELNQLTSQRDGLVNALHFGADGMACLHKVF